MNKEELEALTKEGTVVLDFWGAHCAPCKAMMPVLEKLCNEQSIKLVKLNVQENMHLLKDYKVTSIPHLVLYKNGKEVATNVGFKGSEALSLFLKSE